MENVRKGSSEFFWRRMHSFTGFWLVLFLIEHLFVNSQAALYLGDYGSGFIRAANYLKNLPFLPIIEITLLGIPIAIHLIWGIVYLRTGQFNSFPSDGSTPSLVEYPRNHAYTWQRITSWILLFTLLFHIVQMRFLDRPEMVNDRYIVHLEPDPGLPSVSEKLHVTLQSTENEVTASAPDFGTAELFAVRERFKDPVMIGIYTIFVLAACFHGFNGLWTFMITWGVTLTQRSQRIMRLLSTLLMCLVAFLGLAAIWLTYWVNLKQ